MKQFAISIFCDLAYSTPRVRDLLCQHNGIDFFIEIIESDQVNWHAGALRSIAAWYVPDLLYVMCVYVCSFDVFCSPVLSLRLYRARVDTERVEKKLVEPHALSCIVSLFKQQPVFEAVVVELDSLTQSSTLLVKVGNVLPMPMLTNLVLLLLVLACVPTHHPNNYVLNNI